MRKRQYDPVVMAARLGAVETASLPAEDRNKHTCRRYYFERMAAGLPPTTRHKRQAAQRGAVTDLLRPVLARLSVQDRQTLKRAVRMATWRDLVRVIDELGGGA